MREKIDFQTVGLGEAMAIMSEGNPGAGSVLTSIFAKYQMGIGVFLEILDDMNIRGTQIWVGYKDYCCQNLDKFVFSVLARDPGIVDCINEEGRMGNHTEIAVTNSFYSR